MVNANDSNALWGRKWEISFIPAGGGSALILSSSDFNEYCLKSQFTVDRPGYQAVQRADVTIWNLNNETISKLMMATAGVQSTTGTVVIQAGYENGNYGLIYSGDVFHVRLIREGVVDSKLILHCVDGMNLIYGQCVSLTFSAGTDQTIHINEICSKAQIEVGMITSDINTKTLPRGKVVFGEPSKFLRQIAQDNNGQFYYADGKLNVTKITDVATGQALVISPDNGLIGYPEQFEGGVRFTCLLNPLIKLIYPAMMIQFDVSKTYINQSQLQPGSDSSGGLPYLLNPTGQYKVVRVSHHGDTRDNDWYTEVLAVTDKGLLPYLPASQSDAATPN